MFKINAGLFIWMDSHLTTFSDFSSELFTHAGDNGDEALFLALLEDFLDLGGNILEMFGFWEVDIGLDFALWGEELKSVVINIQKGIFISLNDWGIDHISSVESALVDLLGEDVLSLQDNLGGSVLSWLGS